MTPWPLSPSFLGRRLSGRLRNGRTGSIVVLTGVMDYVSDGTTVVRLSNGHPLLGKITGSGCIVGTAIATFCAGASMAEGEHRLPNLAEDAKLVRGDMLAAAVGGYAAFALTVSFFGHR